jgi:hypothetical protein
VERHVLADATPTLTSVQHYLSEYTAILPAIHALLWDLARTNDITDATVMNVLYNRTRCGVASLQAVLERLLWNCNQIMYRHLSAWYVRLSSIMHMVLRFSYESLPIRCSNCKRFAKDLFQRTCATVPAATHELRHPSNKVFPSPPPAPQRRMLNRCFKLLKCTSLSSLFYSATHRMARL